MGPSYSLCAWCMHPNAENWDVSLCRNHEAEYEGVSEAELDRRDSEQHTEEAEVLGDYMWRNN